MLELFPIARVAVNRFICWPQVNRSKDDHEDTNHALLYSILTEPSSASKVNRGEALVPWDRPFTNWCHVFVGLQDPGGTNGIAAVK